MNILIANTKSVQLKCGEKIDTVIENSVTVNLY